MAFFLAIDAGGTKTDYLLADESRTLARARTDTIKRMRADSDTAALNLEKGLQQLTSASGIPMSAVNCTCIGTAGETVPLVANWLRSALSSRVAGNLLLLGDVEIALDAAFKSGPGVLVLAGTGSNVAGRTPTGALSTCGGWGPALADQGSGYAVGARALRSIFLAIDEGRETELLQAVLNFWNLASLEALIEFANRVPWPDVSRLPHLVLRCANEGDAIAREVLAYEGRQLGYLVRLLIRRMRSGPESELFVPSLAFAGSIMENVQRVRHALIDDVHSEFPQTTVMPGVVDPIEGALFRAREVGSPVRA